MASRTSQTLISNFQGFKSDNAFRFNDPNVLEIGKNAGLYRGSILRTPGYQKLFTNMTSGSAAANGLTASGTTATFVATVAHGLKTGTSVTVAGATDTKYNITATITVTTTLAFTYTIAAGATSPDVGSPTYTATTFGTEPVQTIFPMRKFDGTDRLFVATEASLWMLNTGATAFVNHNHKDQTGAAEDDYGGSSSLVWSLATYLNKIYATNYGFTPTYYNSPQVANGDYAQGSTVAISGTPTWASNEMTMTATGHGCSTGDVIEIAGLSGSTYNPIGTFQCIATNANTLKVQLFTDPGGTIGTSTPTIRKTHLFGSAYVPVDGFKAKIVRAFENHLIYFNVYDGSTDQPMTFYYSDIGDPTDWSTGDASFSAIPDGGDAIMTAEIIPPYMAIYKERSIWLLSYTGGTFVWENKLGVMNFGAFGSRSVINLGNEHYFMAKDRYGLFDGFYRFNGSYVEELENQEGIRNLVRDEINTTNPDMVYAEYLSDKQECRWHYLSASGTTYPDKVVVYNKHDKTWYFEEPANANGYITCGVEFELTTSTTIDGLDSFASTIDTLPYPVDSVYYNGKNRYVLLGDSSGRVYKQDNSTTFDGTAISTRIARTDFYLDDDRDKLKYVSRIILIFKDAGDELTMKFRFGSRLTEGSNTRLAITSGLTQTERQDDVIDYDPEQTFTLVSGRTNYSYNLLKPGKLFSWALSTSANEIGFQLDQIIIEYTTGGII